METETNTNFISVELPLAFVDGLLALTHLMDSRVTEALRAAVEARQGIPATSKFDPPPLPSGSTRAGPVPHDTELAVEILGRKMRGTTLPDLFARCVDMIYEIDPSAIERLAIKKTHARRYVAHRSDDIHIKSPHLKTMKTENGWWISMNISEQQFLTALRLLTHAANLTYGKDVIFPAPFSRPMRS